MKRIAIIFFGISYNPKIKHWYKNWSYSINYADSLDNYKEYIFNYFTSLGYEIDIFFATNNSCKETQILNDLKPKSYIFCENLQCRFKSVQDKIVKGIELCINYSKENMITYDTVLITRFDLHFKKSFFDSNIILDQVNLVSILEKSHLVCDNLYIFPFEHINKFLQIFKSLGNRHNMLSYLKSKRLRVNFILNENVSIGKLSFYKIVRNKI